MAAQAFFAFAHTVRGASSSVSVPIREAARRHGLLLCVRAAATGSGSGGGSGGGSSSSGSRSKVDPPNLEQLCEKARLSLTPDEVADFTPKIASVVDWFSQLQDVDLENVAPAVRVGELDGASYLRADVPVVFQEGDSMLAAAPEREGPYLKVPKILREEQ